MALNGGKIKEVKVTLLLSSRAEMQKVIEKARAATAFMPKMQLPSAEAFTNQFVKKLPEATVVTNNVVSNASQSLMANYLQHSVNSVAPMMNFQMKATKESVLSQAASIPPVALTANPQMPLYYAMSANPTDYLSYMSMANATANYPIDANKLRDLYNKDKRIDNAPMHQKQHNEYNRYKRSTSRERQRSRSPISSRYDSDEKKDKKRRTRFSSPEKAAAVSMNNPLLQHIPPIIPQQPPKPPQIGLNIPQQPVLTMKMGGMPNANLSASANNMSNVKMPNNIWDVPPPLNLNSYTQFQPNAYNSTGNNSSSSINNSSGALSVGTCIKVANIDKETTYSDVRKFFGGLPIGNNDIKFLTDDNGDHTGVALIRFVSSDSKKQSLTKNGWQLKSTQIMITSISEDDFENGLDSSRARSNRDNNYRRDNNRNYDDSRRGDRYNDRFRDRSDSRERNYDRNDRNDRNDRSDRNDRFQNRNMNNNFNNRNNQNNRYNNNNNDRFDKDRDRGSNYGGGHRNNNNNNNNNNNYNNNRRDFRRDNEGRNRNFRDNEPEEKIEYIPDENFTVLVIDDIPDKNEADLFEAFPDILGITIDKYTAYCKFRTHEAAKAVLENRFLHYIRNKRVFVEKGAEAQYDDLVKKYGKFDNPEFADEIRSMDDKKAAKSPENSEQSTSTGEPEERKKPAYESRDPRQKSLNNDKPSSNSANSPLPNFKTDCILIKNLDLQSSIEDVEKFFADVNIQRTQMRTHILLDKRGQPCGDCFVEFKFENDIQKAITKNNQQLGPNRVQIMPIPREQVEAVLSSFGNDESRQQNRPPNRDWAPPPDFGNPGCVVMMSNLCYRATIDDILDEFREFDLKADQIIRRYNDFGQPTGNACINFNSSEDAIKACDEYNKVQILNRPVWLRRL